MERCVCTVTKKLIEPMWKVTPLIWTPNLQPFYSRRVLLIWTTTRRGQSSIRIYPLKPDKIKYPYPPSNIFASCQSKYLNLKGTHMLYKHPEFVIFRPLVSVYYKTFRMIKRKEVGILPLSLLTLIKHIYFTNYISDSEVDGYIEKLEKIEKISARRESKHQGERKVAERKTLQWCAEILKTIKPLIKEELQ